MKDSAKGLLIFVLLLGLTTLAFAGDIDQVFDGGLSFQIIIAALKWILGFILVIGILYMLIKKTA